MPLTPEQIVELGKKTAHEVNRRTEAELFDPKVQRELHLGMVVTKDQMLSEETLSDVQRVVPEDVDDSA